MRGKPDAPLSMGGMEQQYLVGPDRSKINGAIAFPAHQKRWEEVITNEAIRTPRDPCNLYRGRADRRGCGVCHLWKCVSATHIQSTLGKPPPDARMPLDCSRGICFSVAVTLQRAVLASAHLGVLAFGLRDLGSAGGFPPCDLFRRAIGQHQRRRDPLWGN